MPLVTPQDINARIMDLAAKQLQIDLMASQNGMTALAGGGQTGATLITKPYSRFTTVATIADSALLPPAKAGMWCNVINAAANSMNLFPAVGEAINALSANTAFAIAGGKTAQLFSANDGQWHAILSA